MIENRKINLALKAINEYIEIYSVDCYLIHQYGMLYMSEHNLSKAKEYFLKNVEDDSDNKYYSMYEIGMIEKNKYNYKEALKYFDEIINKIDKKYSFKFSSISFLVIPQSTKILNLSNNKMVQLPAEPLEKTLILITTSRHVLYQQFQNM